jgi:hypothetical protein
VTVPTGINDHNQVVGVYQSQDYQIHGYVYSSGLYTSVDAAPPAELPDYPGFELVSTTTWPTGINNSGEVVGYYDATYIDWDTFEVVDVHVPILASPK